MGMSGKVAPVCGKSGEIDVTEAKEEMCLKKEEFPSAQNTTQKSGKATTEKNAESEVTGNADEQCQLDVKMQ